MDAGGGEVDIGAKVAALMAKRSRSQSDFGDRLSGRLRKKLYAQHEELADSYPDDWPVTPREPRE